ncbi:Translation initiation factor IF-1 [Candidatus Hepatincolaceae symbiont of Richtersius coronifer]
MITEDSDIKKNNKEGDLAKTTAQSKINSSTSTADKNQGEQSSATEETLENSLGMKIEGDIVACSGEVIEVLPATKFKVQLIGGAIILAHTSGKMRKNRIKVLKHDTVNVEISLSDYPNLKNKNSTKLVNGRIIFRNKK